MTEDEAKTKWCPHARVVCESTAGLQGPYNRADLANVSEGASARTAPKLAPCLGSNCMAWRWSVSPEQVEKYKKLKSESKSDYYQDYPDTEDGYCGLAGVPVT